MYRVTFNGVDYVAPDLATLQQWLNEGRVVPQTFVWVDSNQTHLRAAEVPGLVFPGHSGYAEPPQAGGYPRSGYYEKVPNNLVWAILATVFCCVPFGVVAIVYAAQVDGHAARGDIARARDSADKARNWAIASMLSVIVIIGGYVLLALVIGASGVGR